MNEKIPIPVTFNAHKHHFRFLLHQIGIWKEGKDTERFIHIHPAKQSAHTIRVRAATLKTVLTLMTTTDAISHQMNENLQTVNQIRTAYLHLSPIKSLQRGKGILQLWELFFSYY